jgi:hypothetical protein
LQAPDYGQKSKSDSQQVNFHFRYLEAFKEAPAISISTLLNRNISLISPIFWQSNFTLPKSSCMICQFCFFTLKLILLRNKFSFSINNLGPFSTPTYDIITDQSVKYKYITKVLPWWRWR